MKYVLYQLSVFLSFLCIAVTAGGEGSVDAQTGILREAFLNYKAPAYWKGGEVDWFRCADTAQVLGEFEYSIRRGGFTSRYSTILTVPEDGNYRFHIAGNTELRLYASLTGDEQNVDRIARVFLNSGKRVWDGYHDQKSDVFKLKKGQDVVLIALHRQNKHVCNVSVGWSRDEGPIEIIPGRYCRIPWSRWGAHAVGTPTLYSKGDSFIEFDWPRHLYGIGIKSFTIFRNGEILAENVKRYTYIDTTVTAGNSYTYTIQAVDHMERVTPKSAPLTVMAQPRDPDKVCELKGTGLRAAYYLPTHVRDVEFEWLPSMENHIDTTFFLNNRKATSVVRNNALPSFDYYIKNIIYMDDFSRRSVRMEGFLDIPFEGNWTFTAQVSDGIRVWVNRKLVISNAYRKGMHSHTRTVRLHGRTKVPIRIECRTPSVQLEWQHIMVPRQVIPRDYLYPSTYLESGRLDVISESESFVSPAHLEVMAGNHVSSVECTSNGRTLTARKLSDYNYAITDPAESNIGVSLKPSLDEATPVTISFSDAHETKARQTAIRWKPVVLNASSASPSKVAVRAGDSLLFCTGTGKLMPLTSLIINPGNDERRLAGKDGVFRWENPGTFMVHGTLKNGRSMPVQVTVHATTAYPKIIMLLGTYRYWSKPRELDTLYIEPANDRSFVILDPFLLGKERYILASGNLGESSIVVRLAEGKEIVTMIPTDTFNVWQTSTERQAGKAGLGTTLHKNYSILSHYPGPIRAVSICRSRVWLSPNGTAIQSFPITDNFRNPLSIDVYYRGNIKVGHAWRGVRYYQQDQKLESIQLSPEP